MRAAAILGPGNVARAMIAFQRATGVQWTSLIEQADVAVIFGGDGTVHRHLASLVDLDIPLLVVPCGSGNDFARALGICGVRDSIRAMRDFSEHGHVRAVDLGVIRPEAAGDPAPRKYFCCVAGVGLDAAINRRANALPRWLRAHGGYAMCATREILGFAPFPMRISSNGIVGAFRPTMLAAVANAPTYGGGMKIAPKARLDDGQLDLCMVSAMNVFKLFCLFPTVYLGRHLDFSEVEHSQTPTVRIETEFPFDIYADGEYVCQTPVEFSVVPKALKVLSPISTSGDHPKC